MTMQPLLSVSYRNLSELLITVAEWIIFGTNNNY